MAPSSLPALAGRLLGANPARCALLAQGRGDPGRATGPKPAPHPEAGAPEFGTGIRRIDRPDRRAGPSVRAGRCDPLTSRPGASFARCPIARCDLTGATMRPPPGVVKGFSLRPQGCPQDFLVVPSHGVLVNRKATGCPPFDRRSPASAQPSSARRGVCADAGMRGAPIGAADSRRSTKGELRVRPRDHHHHRRRRRRPVPTGREDERSRPRPVRRHRRGGRAAEGRSVRARGGDLGGGSGVLRRPRHHDDDVARRRRRGGGPTARSDRAGTSPPAPTARSPTSASRSPTPGTTCPRR